MLLQFTILFSDSQSTQNLPGTFLNGIIQKLDGLHHVTEFRAVGPNSLLPLLHHEEPVGRVTAPPVIYSTLCYGVDAYHYVVDSTSMHQNNHHAYTVNFCNIDNFEKCFTFDQDKDKGNL